MIMWTEIVPPLAVSLYLFGLVFTVRRCNRYWPAERDLNAWMGILWPVFWGLCGVLAGWTLIMDDSASPSRKPDRVSFPASKPPMTDPPPGSRGTHWFPEVGLPDGFVPPSAALAPPPNLAPVDYDG
jgi:hypothetical protein